MAIRNELTQDVGERLAKFLRKKLGKTPVVEKAIFDMAQGVKDSQKNVAQLARESDIPLTFTGKGFPSVARNLGLQAVPKLDYLHPTQILDLPRATTLRAMESNIEVMADAFNDPEFLKILDSGKFMDPEEALAFYWNARSDLQRAGQGILKPETIAGASAVMSPRTTPVDEVGELTQILTDPRNAYTGRLTYGNVDKAVDMIARQPDWTTGQDRNLIKKLSNKATADDAHWDTKVFNYAINQSQPSNPRGLTGDTHALAIALGLPQFGELGPDIFGNRRVYDLVREAYTNVAKRRGMLPQELQALTWSPWRQLMSNETAMRPMLGNITLAPSVIQAAQGNPLPFLKEAKAGASKAQTRRVASGVAPADAAKSYETTVENLRETARKSGIDPSLLALLLLTGGTGIIGLAERENDQAGLDALRRIS